MPLDIQTIDRFITPGSPLARAGGAQTLVQATGGSLTGAAFLAALARKESEFGRTSGRLGNNLWGWDVHNGRTFPSILEGAQTVWRGLNSGLYKGSGLTTPAAIIARYAPPSENDTGLYQSQVGQWFRQLGLAPDTNIFSGGAAAPIPTAQQFTLPGPRPTPGPVRSADGTPAPAVLQLTPLAQKRLAAYLRGSREDVLSGRSPRSILPVLAALGTAPVAPAGVPAGVTDYGGRTRAATSGFPGAQDPGPGGLYGFQPGSVDSGLAFRGGEGGDWGGSMERALALARAVGARPSSQKRSRKLTASGNPSDHWVGSTASYATDLPTSGKAGDALLVQLSHALGVPLRAGQWNNVNIGGYRYQVGWRVPGHYDHIHVGVRRL